MIPVTQELLKDCVGFDLVASGLRDPTEEELLTARLVAAVFMVRHPEVVCTCELNEVCQIPGHSVEDVVWESLESIVSESV